MTSRNILVFVCLILVGGVGTFVVQSRLEKREQESKTALYKIQKTFQEENKLVPEADRTPGTTLDVDAKYPKTLAELNGLIAAKSAPSRVLFEAALKMGNLYFEHNQFVKAEPVFQKAVDFAGSSFQKSSAWYFLGVSQEKTGDAKKALESFQRGLNENVDGLKAEILLGLVRTSLKAGDKNKAKGFADRLNREFQGSKSAEVAQALVKENS